jgi:hypothetical protein
MATGHLCFQTTTIATCRCSGNCPTVPCSLQQHASISCCCAALSAAAQHLWLKASKPAGLPTPRGCHPTVATTCHSKSYSTGAAHNLSALSPAGLITSLSPGFPQPAGPVSSCSQQTHRSVSMLLFIIHPDPSQTALQNYRSTLRPAPAHAQALRS